MFWLFKGFFYVIGGAATLTAGLASYLAFLQPPFYFPQPTGKYAVGTATYHFVDEHRKTVTQDSAPGKELMVQIWYPSSEDKMTQKPTAPYAPYYVDYFKRNQKMAWLLTMARPMYTYATNNAPLIQNEQQLPVIIFSHGLGCTRNTNTAHCEELASHGYIVVGINHSFGCTVTKFPDDRIVAANLEELQKGALDNPMQLFKMLNNNVELWIDDMQMVLDNLARITTEKSSFLYNRLDMNHIGMLGHSYGGATAAQMCRRDPRIKAGVDMDGALLGPNRTEPLHKPFMFLLGQPITKEEMFKLMEQAGLKGEHTKEYAEAIYQSYLPAIDKLVQETNHDMYKLTIKGAEHLTFCDMAIIKEGCLLARPMQNLGAGKLNGYRVTEIINSYLLSFFDKYLKGVDSPLLDNEKSKYPEVEMVAKQDFNQLFETR